MATRTVAVPLPTRVRGNISYLDIDAAMKDDAVSVSSVLAALPEDVSLTPFHLLKTLCAPETTGWARMGDPDRVCEWHVAPGVHHRRAP